MAQEQPATTLAKLKAIHASKRVEQSLSLARAQHALAELQRLQGLFAPQTRDVAAQVQALTTQRGARAAHELAEMTLCLRRLEEGVAVLAKRAARAEEQVQALLEAGRREEAKFQRREARQARVDSESAWKRRVEFEKDVAEMVLAGSTARELRAAELEFELDEWFVEHPKEKLPVVKEEDEF